MTPEEAAVQSAEAVSNLTSRFMLDMATYQYGAEIGFPGMAFYTGGRGGVLGDVDANAVTEALVVFQPDQVASNWEQAGAVMPRDNAAVEFQKCCSKWGEEHLPDDVDATTLASLARKVADAADTTDAPVFAGWRKLTSPESPKAAACHYMNALRELRFALHAQAIRAQGVSPHDAMSHRQPHMLGIAGWGESSNPSPETVAKWEQAEEATNAGMAKALGVLSPDELDTFVALANAAYAGSA